MTQGASSGSPVLVLEKTPHVLKAIQQILLSQLKEPTQSDICQKCSVASNPLRCKHTKQSSGSSCTSDPASVSPQQKAKESSSEFIGVSESKLFSTVCLVELSRKKSSIQKHATSAKHIAGKEKLAKKEKREMHIVEALKKYDAAVHP